MEEVKYMKDPETLHKGAVMNLMKLKLMNKYTAASSNSETIQPSNSITIAK
jgi:hypothetical protein